MRVLLAGGSSVLGKQIRAGLGDHEVRVLSRTSTDLRADVTKPSTLLGMADGIDVVISAIGASLDPRWQRQETSFDAVDRQGNLNLLAEAVRANVPRFVYMSVFSEGMPESLGYVAAHRAVERALEAAPLTSTVLQPTGFFGSFDLLRDLARRGLAVRIGSGTARTNPIHEADLAAIVCEMLETGPPTLPCGGPEILTRNAITDRLGQSVGRSLRPIPMPPALPRIAAKALGTVNTRLQDLIEFLLYVLTHDGIAPLHGSRRLGESWR